MRKKRNRKHHRPKKKSPTSSTKTGHRQRFLEAQRQHHQGHFAEAVRHYRQLLAADPSNAEVLTGLGSALRDMGQIEQSIECYDKAIATEPGSAPTYRALLNLLKKTGRMDDALLYVQRAMESAAGDARLCRTVCAFLKQAGMREAAYFYYQTFLRDQPQCAHALWGSTHLLPLVYRKEEDIPVWRDRFEHSLQRLEDSIQGKPLDDVQQAISGVLTGSNFYLPYQGKDDKPFQVRFGRLVQQVARAAYPQWAEPPKKTKRAKARIGYASFHFHGHTVAKLFGGWLKAADRDRFEIVGYHLGRKRDRASQTIAGWCDVHRYLPQIDIQQMGGVIREDELDVLVYPSIGMEPVTLLLASLCLAPVQCAAWGHPVTTGLTTIDYFLSSELMEPEDGQAHYSEQLVRLPNLSVYYQRPNVGTVVLDRNEFGLNKEHSVFLCCQYLSKYLPQFDLVFPRIAQALPSARFIFIAHQHESATFTFQNRLTEAFQREGLEVGKYCSMLPRLKFQDFFGLIRMADVYLDTIEWSGGNTRSEALACGLPVVTLPGTFMRGRHTSAMLERMNARETIASSVDEYVELATRLGKDADYRREISRQLIERNELIFHDRQAIDALERFYETAMT